MIDGKKLVTVRTVTPAPGPHDPIEADTDSPQYWEPDQGDTMDDNTTYHLTDRHLATIIHALCSERERLINAGLTGKDCQSALDALYRGLTPYTYGLTYKLGQHERLHSGRILRGDDDGE